MLAIFYPSQCSFCLYLSANEPDPVRVNAIAPGLFPSRMNPADPADPSYNNMKYEKEMPARRAGTEQEMVGTALYLASSAGAYMTGDILRIDGGRVLVVSAKIKPRM